MSYLEHSDIDLETIEEIHRQGETLIQIMVQLALAADQRATTMTGIFGAGAVALLGAAAALIGATTALANVTPGPMI